MFFRDKCVTSYLSSGLFFSAPTDPGFSGVSEAREAEFIHEAVAVHILQDKKCHKLFILYHTYRIKDGNFGNPVSEWGKKCGSCMIVVIGFS